MVLQLAEVFLVNLLHHKVYSRKTEVEVTLHMNNSDCLTIVERPVGMPHLAGVARKPLLFPLVPHIEFDSKDKS